MNSIDNHQVNYWAGGETYEYKSPKPKRSIKRKLVIVLSFILVLAVTPSLIYALSSLNFNQAEEVNIVSSQTPVVSEKEPVSLEVTIEEPESGQNQTEVINNDSYWKISKRVCGTGKYYLSIQTQNNSKALYQGETVAVSCVL